MGEKNSQLSQRRRKKKIISRKYEKINSIVDSIEKIVHNMDATNILVLGCSDINLIKSLKKYFNPKCVQCIDKNLNSIKKAKRNVPEFKYAVMDVQDINKSDYYDIIIDLSFLTHIVQKKWVKFFSEIKRMLRLNGHYLFRLYSKNNNQIHNFHPKRSKRNWNISYGTYDHFFTKLEIMNELGKKMRLKSLGEIVLLSGKNKIRYFIGSMIFPQRKLV